MQPLMVNGSIVELVFKKLHLIKKLLFGTAFFISKFLEHYIDPDILMIHSTKNTKAPMPAMVDSIQKNPLTHPKIPKTIASARSISHSLR